MEVKHIDDLTVFDARGDYIRAVQALMVRWSINGTHDKPHESRRAIMEQYTLKANLEGYCMLFADGCSRLRKPLSPKDVITFNNNRIFEWIYGDHGEIHPVQEWINQQDGKYLALFLNVCNPLNLDVQSKSSILFVPDNIYSVMSHASKGIVRMFVPGHGYYEDVPQGKITVIEFLAEIYRLARRELKVLP